MAPSHNVPVQNVQGQKNTVKNGSSMNDSEVQQRQEIAARVRYWMARRKLTREIFAGLVGKSVSWVDKIRTGDRALDRLSVLRTVADVLGIPLHVLIGYSEDELVPSCPNAAQIGALEEALHSYSYYSQPLARQPLAKLKRQVEYAWVMFQASNWSFIGTVLPNLINQLHVHARSATKSRESLELLVLTYHLAAEAAFKLDRMDLGWVAADRAVHFAEETADVALVGGSGRRVVHAMMAAPASRRRGLDFAQSMQDRLEPHLGAGQPDVLTAYGSLLLKASIAYARAGNTDRAIDLNNHANAVAAELDADANIHWSMFGPTNVAIHRASAYVELRDGPGALKASAQIAPKAVAGMTAGRRAQYWLNIARGYMLCGKPAKAGYAVLQAEQAGKAAVHCRPYSRALINDIINGTPTKPDPSLIRLARAVGIDT